jgi:hypothetical protein
MALTEAEIPHERAALQQSVDRRAQRARAFAVNDANLAETTSVTFRQPGWDQLA